MFLPTTHHISKVFALILVLLLVCSPILNALSISISGSPAVETAYATHGGVHDATTGQNGAGDTETFFQKVGRTVGVAFLMITGHVTWLGGRLLDWTMNEFVLNMGTQMATVFGGPVDSAWGLIRDLCNIIFIFGFVYIGIWTILDPSRTDTKRFLSRLIIAALLINFSLFFVKLIIDVANLFAVEIYNLMSTRVSGVGRFNIGEQFMNLMGLSSIYSTTPSASLPTVDWNATFGNASLAFFVMGSIFQLIAGFVFLAGGIMIIMRFIMLLFYMIFSPILFAAMVFPQTQRLSSNLWNNILSNAFFAPLYLLFIYISYALVAASSQTVAAGGTTLAQALKNEGNYQVAAYFFLIIMFMIISLIAAKNIGAVGGAGAVRVMNNVKGYGQRRVRNVGRWSGRKLQQGATATAKAPVRASSRLVGAGLRNTRGRRAGQLLKDTKISKELLERAESGDIAAAAEVERKRRDQQVHNAAAAGDKGAIRKLQKAERNMERSFEPLDVLRSKKDKSGRSMKATQDAYEKEQKKIVGLIQEDSEKVMVADANKEQAEAEFKRQLKEAERAKRAATEPVATQLAGKYREQALTLRDAKSTDAEKSAIKGEIKGLEMQLAQLNQTEDEKLELAKSQIKEAQDTANTQYTVDKNGNRLGYADQVAEYGSYGLTPLRGGGRFGRWTYNGMMRSSYENRLVAESMRKEIKKTSSDKSQDKLLAAIEKINKDGS